MRHLLLAALLLAGAGLRARPLTANRFHPDEALYATFGRLIASGRDPLLATVVVDKPPLPYYLIGSSQYLFGDSEFAARLPALFASVLSVALLHRAGRRLYDRETALAATALFALSPFAISFAPTVFIDPPQAACLLWALLEAARGRWGAAGIAAGAALAFKQTTLAFVPLLLWLLWRAARGRPTGRQAALFAAPLLVVALASTAWDLSRAAEVGFWQQGYTDNMPERFAAPAEIGPRLREVVRLLAYTTGQPLVFLAGLAGLAVLFRPGRMPRWDRMDLGLGAFVALYAAAYWLLAFNLWDRYFLALVPLLCLLLARGTLALIRRSPRGAPHWLPPVLLAVLMAPAALTAAHSGFPLGGDHGAYDGIDLVADYLRGAPADSVLYDRWLSWELRYYLDQAPIYLVWLPDAETLTVDLRAFGAASPRYFVSPSWEDDTAVRRAAEAAGYEFRPEFSTTRRDGSTSFTVYRLLPRAG